MTTLAPLLLEIWRECCRHIEIEEATARGAELLANRLPLAGMLVRRLDVARGAVETCAVAGSLGQGASLSPLSAPALESLVAWAREGQVVKGGARELTVRLPGLVPDGLDGEVLAGPLAGEAGPTGFLLLVAAPAAQLDRKDAALAQALLEPFSTALDNDRRVRAMAEREAAAEADRRSLLSRLGRSDLGETIVGAEAGFRPVMERAHLVAPSDVPVLVLGETGSGKEVVARAIHLRSRRAPGPFLRVNCGAIPQGLIDSELFGHERGSFTGADAQRKGWFERADGGTLFLDEIGELPLQAQVRLLRILQDGSFERVGGQRPLHVDVRIVAATHRDLRAMVADGRFREDLWYRIAVFPIQLPPLRERPEDIPALATHFALRAANRFGTPPRLPTPEDLELLLAYRWPGNVRELTAVIERAVILGNGQSLEVATALGASPGAHDSPESEPARAVASTEPDRPKADPDPATGDLAPLDTAIRRHIEAALERTRGRIEGPRGAAALLQINPHTLRAKMRRLRIDWRRFRPD
jgi:transcriptional regulator with GAF, ATPase, and Fis domain